MKVYWEIATISLNDLAKSPSSYILPLLSPLPPNKTNLIQEV